MNAKHRANLNQFKPARFVESKKVPGMNAVRGEIEAVSKFPNEWYYMKDH